MPGSGWDSALVKTGRWRLAAKGEGGRRGPADPWGNRPAGTYEDGSGKKGGHLQGLRKSLAGPGIRSH